MDVNKGDDQNLEYRSRLVAKEIKKDKREDLFAATPPLEAKKILLSMAATQDIGYVKGRKHMKYHTRHCVRFRTQMLLWLAYLR